MPHTSARACRRTNLASGALLLALAGCNIDYEVVEAEEGDGTASAGTGGAGADGGVGPSGSGNTTGPDGPVVTDPRRISDAPPDEACQRGGECSELAVTNIDKIDLLFMVDNSGSMREEQAALRAEFPKLIRVLTNGDLQGDDVQDFPPAKNLHLGVVSSDLGVVNVTGIDRCAGLGNDGVMNNVASTEVSGCSASGYPRFLTYTTYTAGTNDPATTAVDFACIATLGTDGCGFEQQLESTLKAVWPTDDTRVTFLPDPEGFGATGQGDAIMGGTPGMNAGFLRNDPVQGLSLVSIVLVTDEEDCSSKDTSHLRPSPYLDPNTPADAELLKQGLNVRCNFNPQNLYIKDRYILGFKALRPGNEELVLFSAIVGVPPETVAQVPADYGENPAAQAAFYHGIRSHALMQPMVDTLGTPSPDDDTMRPSCDTANGRAYPPNRIVDVAEGFGANGLVQSICQDDFGPAMDAIIDRIASRLGSVCLPRALERGADGAVSCDVIWQLPRPGQNPVGTPSECSQAAFLLPVGDDVRAHDGGALCRVAQLAVRDDAGSLTPMPTKTDGQLFSEGWYYDDFSAETQHECMTSPKARVWFTSGAMPPTGVRVFLDCAR